MTKLTSIALAATVLLSGAAYAQDSQVYIIQLKDEPAASYTGTVAGYAATQVAKGAHYSARALSALAYTRYLLTKHNSVLSTVAGARALTHYDTVFNGFTAKLTRAEAAQLAGNADVAGVYEDTIFSPATISTPVFLGLRAAGGVWSQTDASGLAVKGENMILGDLDLGIWPESPSYADHVDNLTDNNPTFNGGVLAYGPPPATWLGTCVAGDAFVPAQACNNKLIGARAYSTNLMAGRTFHWTSFNSPRDDLGGATGHGGHGDHTASTVAGNDKVPAIVSGVTMGLASGMAPRARIAAYKVCFTYVNTAATDGTGSTNSCSQADSMAAIDQAVKDGVNALNFSISGSTSTTNDLVEQAFYRATLAGIFVAAAAGNSGPANTVNHPSPWLATIAAATHDRLMAGDVTLATGAKYSGASLNVNPLGSAPLIRAEDAALGTLPATLCFSDPTAAAAAGQSTLDPNKVSGKIVICTRGTNARVDKSLAVLNASGVGMVLMDNGAGLVSEVHSVPTVHVTAADGSAIKSYAVAAGSGAAAAESAFYFGKQPAPTIAAFSGRGPNLADVNILKPDMAAPGVGVIASVTPAYTQDQRNQLAAGTLAGTPAWASYDGTSMATPHVTGVSLLLKQAHPTWSPAAIKSAMMTTAMDTLDDGLTGMQNGKLPWSQGSGFIVPNKAIDPGLVYDMGKADFVKYECLTQPGVSGGPSAADCTTYGKLDQTYNLNLPTITLGAMTGTTTLTRTVTNVGVASATYTPTIVAPTTMTMTVSPTSLVLTPGQSKSFTVTIAPTSSTPKFTWEYGSLTWNDGTHVVRSPVQANLGQAIVAPADLTASTASGSKLFSITSGFTGKSAVNKGIKDVTVGAVTSLTPSASVDIGSACATGAALPSLAVYSFTVPTGAIVARFAIRQADVSGASDDNDLAVVSPNGTKTVSGGGTSNEMVELLNPAAGVYKVCVQAYAGTAPMTHKLSSWIVSPNDTAAPGAFMVLMPASVYAGNSASVAMGWSSLTAGHRYIGAAQFLDASAAVAAATALYVDLSGTSTTGAEVPVQNPAKVIKARSAKKVVAAN